MRLLNHCIEVMLGIENIIYKGKAFLYLDYRALKTDQELVAFILEIQSLVLAKEEPFVQLTDLRGVALTKAFLETLRKAARETPKIARKRAVLGLDSLAKQVLLKSYNATVKGEGPVRSFDNKEEALEWLVEE